MTPVAGPADWDTHVLTRPQVLDADATGRSGPLAATATAALAAVGDGNAEAAAASAAILGRAGVVAVRGGGRSFEVRETLESWELAASPVPTPDAGDLAGAAVIRARRLAEARRLREDRR